MSILLQNASAAFVQSAQPDGRYHLVVSADLVGHSELQDRLIRKIAQSASLKREVEVVKGPNNVPQLRVHLSASESDVQRLIALENENRAQKVVEMGRSYSDVAADADFVAPFGEGEEVAVEDAEEVVKSGLPDLQLKNGKTAAQTVADSQGASNGPAQSSDTANSDSASKEE